MSGGSVKKIIEVVKEHGMTFMMAGMFTLILGVGVFFAAIHPPLRNSPTLTLYARQIAWVLVFIGFGVYVVGRVSVAMAKRRAQVRELALDRRGRPDDDEL
jgi:hypothetical protein